MPLFKSKSKSPTTTSNPPAPTFQYQNAYVAPPSQLSAPFQHVANQQHFWEQPVHSQNYDSLVPFGSTTIARPNSALQGSPQWAPPSPRTDSTTIVSYGDTAVERHNPMVHNPQQWLPPPPPLPPRFSPPATTNSLANSSIYPGRPELGRTSSSTSSLPSPSYSIPTPPSSDRLEAPRHSPWAPPGSARSPSPFAVPQRKQQNSEPPKTRKILSLDGGGIRGLSIIITLKYIMSNLNRKRGTPLEPWQEFDMIGGTSTGGLIAIMLGRLRMSLKECEAAYIQLSKEIFTPVRDLADPRRVYDFFKANGKFDEKPLESCIKEAVKRNGLDEDALLEEVGSELEPCKVFVCATRGENSAPAVIRSYQTNNLHDPLLEWCKIWEAARATSAASTFFEPVEIGPLGEIFVDGALRRNNPIREADRESRDLWPGAERLIISIGTGSAPGGAVTGSLITLAQRLKDIVVDSEQTSQDFEAENEAMIKSDRLFRFNVYHGLADVGLEEHKAVNRIAAHTNSYLNHPQVTRQVNTCVQSLRSGGQRLGYATLEELTAMMADAQLKGVLVHVCASCLQGIEYNEIYHYCETCAGRLCTNCQGSHDWEHYPQSLSFISIAWTPTMQIAKPTSSCTNCTRQVKARTECTVCLAALCLQCDAVGQIRETFLKDHRSENPRHKSFREICPPYIIAKPPSSWQCGCLTNHGIGGHCDRCLEIFPNNTKFYNCQTCRVEYGAAQDLCQKCKDEEDPEHQKNHDFTCFTICRTLDKPDDVEIQKRTVWRCEQCPFEAGPATIVYHPHLMMRMCIGDALADALRQGIPPGCPRGLPRKLYQPEQVNAVKINCMTCMKYLEYDTRSLVCFTCGQACCHECNAAQNYWHRHPLSRITLRKKAATICSWRCDLCNRLVNYEPFTGFECVNCRNYQSCSQCLGQNKYPQHPFCNGAATDWDLVPVVK